MKLHHHAPSTAMLLLLLISQLLQLQSARSAATDGGGFVTTSGIHFAINGKPFYSHGFNAYWLMTVAYNPSQRNLVTNALNEASSHGLHIARTWAFSDGVRYAPLQISPGNYNEQTFRGLDFVVTEAGKHGIKLILSLVNNYKEFGGRKQYVEWARSQGQSVSSEDDFYTNPVVKGFYKNHVTTVLNRRNTINGVTYKDDPTIMAWELINEPRCQSDLSGKMIQDWVTEMAAHVKSIDNKHLLEIGLEGFYGNTTPNRMKYNAGNNVGTDFVANNKVPGIDFATIHSYPEQWLSKPDDQTQLTFIENWIHAHLQDSQAELNKPLIVAEFGKSKKASGYTTAKRDEVYALVYYKVYESAKGGGAAAGSLFWQLMTKGTESYFDGYEVILGEDSSTTNLIADESRKLSEIGK